MPYRTNPFEELYVSETIPPRDFVQLFSPFLVHHALPLFQRGNVLLRGTQGSGKSMLLSLLKPAIRVAYVEAKADFPVPKAHRRFIAAGINLRKSGVLNLGQRPIEEDPADDRRQFPYYFGDFLNYWFVDDLLETIQTFVTRAGGSIGQELGLNQDDRRLTAFTQHLAADPCWFGALDHIKDYGGLRARLRDRITKYFHFLNWNAPEFPSDIRRSRTTIGVPVARTAFHLRDAGVLPEDVGVFVQVDQYEELGLLAQIHGDLGGRYKEVINRAMSVRDQQVSFRVGARRWAWPEGMKILGTSAVLERERDFTVVDLDELLVRREHPGRGQGPFVRFAEEVVQRRLRFAGFDTGADAQPVLPRVFGARPPVHERAQMYVKKCAPERIVRVTLHESAAWHAFLTKLAQESPLEAKLAEAWARQQGGQRLRQDPRKLSDRGPKVPWRREYWLKERREQALMQLAAGCAQRMVWAGEDDLVALSGGNILVFVSLCRQVWAAYLRADRETETAFVTATALPRIPVSIQSVGLHEASEHWYEKTPEQPEGSSRQRFIDLLGRLFRKLLLDDQAMSYPGRNGFSLAASDLEAHPTLRDFLRSAVVYGDLVEAPHTTKEKDRMERTKWYLKPVLSPHFQIPVAHMKEPLYVRAEQVESWRSRADRRAGASGPPVVEEDVSQIPLFPES